MPVDTVVDLIILLRQYRLVEPAQLDELARVIAPRFSEPRSLAKELIQRNWLTPYQINQLFKGNGADLVFDNFVLLERLGEGGMGQVFKARHRKLGQIVALKIIRKDRNAGPDSIRRFEREIQTASTLVHPNIVRAIDANEVDGTPFFVMEYVEGTDLARLVKQQGPLPPAQAAEYIRQAALGLQHAHEKGLVHRDIKPANLLLTKQGVIKLVDMGLARRESVDDTASTALTQLGSVLGTPDYIAPEQARNSKNADIRSDLYSLGCTFYFLLTGQPPFPGGALTEKLLKHQLDPPPPLSTFRGDVPPAIAAVIERLMAKRPHDRYQTPAELAAALANNRPPAPGAASVPRPVVNGRPTDRRPPSTVPLAVPVAAVVQSATATIPVAAPVATDPFTDLDTPVPISVTRVEVPKRPRTGPRRRWLLGVAAVLVVLFAVLSGLGAKMLFFNATTIANPPTVNADKDTPQDKDKDKKEEKAKPPQDWWKAREALAKRGARFVPATYDPDPAHPITSVDLSSCPTLTDADMVNLAALPHVTTLQLGATKITDKGLVYLEALPHLTTLGLNQIAVTDEGLSHLRGLTELTDVNLSFTQVQGSGLVHLSGARNLKVLNLTYSKIDDAGLAALAGLPQLEQLTLQVPPNSKQITDAGMVHLKGLTKLKQLSLHDTAVTDAGMVHFKAVGALLTTLDLTNVKVSDAGLSGFKTLIHLQEFQAGGSNVGDQGSAETTATPKKTAYRGTLNGTKVQDDDLTMFQGQDGVEIAEPDGHARRQRGAEVSGGTAETELAQSGAERHRRRAGLSGEVERAAKSHSVEHTGARPRSPGTDGAE